MWLTAKLFRHEFFHRTEITSDNNQSTVVLGTQSTVVLGMESTVASGMQADIILSPTHSVPSTATSGIGQETLNPDQSSLHRQHQQTKAPVQTTHNHAQPSSFLDLVPTGGPSGGNKQFLLTAGDIVQ